VRDLGKLLCACLASLALYGLLFALVLDRPLSDGTLRLEMQRKLAYAARLPSPKLLVLAGSNAAYSHRCQVIGPMLRLPCVNGGIALGIGLDDQFTRWEPLLHPGDIVYLPMEFAQYTVSHAANRLGPDAAILLRHNRIILARLPPGRWLGAFFAADLRALVLSAVEMAVHTAGLAGPRRALAGKFDAAGDRIGATAAKARRNQAFLATLDRADPTAAQIDSGYGSIEIIRFLHWATAHHVHAIGGLPTEFAAIRLPAETLAATGALYRRNHAGFLMLPGESRYPHRDFYDSPDHLVQGCQIAHSIAVARALAKLLRRAIRPPPAWVKKHHCR